MKPGIPTTMAMRQISVNCKIAMGIGRSIAMMDPMLGIKLSKKARAPNIGAISRPRSSKTNQVNSPVANEANNFANK